MTVKLLISKMRLCQDTQKLSITVFGLLQRARGLYSNTKGEPSGLTALFIEYLFSTEGRQIVMEKGFIPVR